MLNKRWRLCFIDGGHGAHIDDNGDIWQSGSENILHYKCLGLDANNIPLYTGKYELIAAPTPAPSPDVKVKRVYYDVKLDRMYTAGATITQPTIDSWQSMGRAINRYDNWSTGNRTASLPELVLPAVTVNGFTVPISFKVVDEYIFVGFLGGDNTIPRLQLNIYKVSDHSFVGYIRAPWEGVGLFDVIQSIDGYKRKNGEYVIVVEEDGRNKNVMYRWTPAGPLIETTNILTANTNYVKFTPAAASQALTIASNIAWTVTGAPTWLTATPSGSGNGTAILTATANTGNTSRSAIITLAGGAVSNQITLFQEFSDTVLPINATTLTATKITPFDFSLNWIESTDNVMVSGYEIFKNGVLYKTIAGTNIDFTGLMPNSAYTILVKAYDEAGNKSTGTTLIVNTLDVTYPYITARGHANFETPQRAFDGNNGSTWMDWEGNTWLQIQYAAPVVYNQYAIYNRDNPNREMDPKNWVVQGSNDGIIFTDLSTQNSQNWAAPITSKNYYFINSTAYSYYKLNFKNGNGLVLGEVIFNNGPIIDTQAPTAPIALTASGITQNSANLIGMRVLTTWG